MEGMTILEIIGRMGTEVDTKTSITICLIAVIVGVILILVGFDYGAIFGFLGLASLACAFYVAYNPLTKEVDVGYEQIIAYVDTDVLSEKQIMEEYEIIKVDGNIYTLRAIEEPLYEEEHVHQWEVEDLAKGKSILIKKQTLRTATLKCSVCHKVEQVTYAN